MFLLADSGATKSDWCLVDPGSGNKKYFTTEGVNPQVQSQVWISDMLKEGIPFTVQQMELNEIIFYGAGISSLKLRSAVEQTLQYVFKTRKISMHHDLLGAVRALCGNQPGIACILGTGSNSALFDGAAMVEKSPALGYILGDEGSGAYIGKKLLTDYLYQQVPKPIAVHLSDVLNLDRETILNQVYQETNPNRYLASFCISLSAFRGLGYVEELLRSSIAAFLRQHVLIYDECREIPVSFSGSIAHHFGDVVANLCEEQHLQLGKILDRPIEELVKYHIKQYHA